MVEEVDGGQRCLLASCIIDNKKKAVQFLIDQGADLNTRSIPERITPLMAAVVDNHEDIVENLIDAKANVVAKDVDGYTALDRAISINNLSIVTLVMKAVCTKQNKSFIPKNTVKLIKKSSGIELVCYSCEEVKKLKKCGNCESVYYCSRECQAADWPTHKHICFKLNDVNKGAHS